MLEHSAGVGEILPHILLGECKRSSFQLSGEKLQDVVRDDAVRRNASRRHGLAVVGGRPSVFDERVVRVVRMPQRFRS